LKPNPYCVRFMFAELHGGCFAQIIAKQLVKPRTFALKPTFYV